MKVYYIGRLLEEPGEDFEKVGVKWSIEGIYSKLGLAFENVENDEFISVIEMDKKYPKELMQPDEYYWCIDNEILDKDNTVVKVKDL